MSFYHEDSPQADEARGELEFGRSAYLQRTTTKRDLRYELGAGYQVRSVTGRYWRFPKFRANLV